MQVKKNPTKQFAIIFVTFALCCIVADDVHPKMRFSLSPPASKAIFSSTINLGSKWNRESGVSKSEYQNGNNNNNNENVRCNVNSDRDTMQREEDRNSNKPSGDAADTESTSDYKQWLHAMKLVARLPGGIPPEFRRKVRSCSLKLIVVALVNLYFIYHNILALAFAGG